MNKSWLIMPFAAFLMPQFAMAYGEGENISIEARGLHLMTNEARMDTKTALSGCGDHCKSEEKCFEKQYEPLYWRDDLYHAAQFHANMLSYLGSCIQHDSPCKLKSSVVEDFPDKCDGNPSCACEGGVATCGSVGTQTFDRIKMFAGNSGAENIASVLGVWGSFYLWLHEDSKNSGCEFTGNNGHRRNILGESYHGIGVGYGAKWTVQDFAWTANEKSALTAGAHFADGDKKMWFKTQYYADVELDKAVVVMNDTCISLQRTGGDSKYGVYGTSEITTSQTCVPYVFEAIDVNGKVTRYPTTGSLLYQCDHSWTKDEIGSCLGDGTKEDPSGDKPSSGDKPASGDQPSSDDKAPVNGEEIADDAGDSCSVSLRTPSSKGIWALFGLIAILGSRLVRRRHAVTN